MNHIRFTGELTNVQIDIAIFVEGDYYIAYSPALDLVGQGVDKHEAVDSLIKTVKITFDWAKEKDTIHKLLLKHGWTLTEKPTVIYSPPKFNAADIKKNFKINRFETERVPVYA